MFGSDSGSTLTHLSSLYLWTFASLLAVCVYKLLKTVGVGMLSSTPGGAAQPERVAVMASTLVAATAYAVQCLGLRAEGLLALPEPSPWIVWLVGGGHSAFLLGKAYRSG